MIFVRLSRAAPRQSIATNRQYELAAAAAAQQDREPVPRRWRRENRIPWAQRTVTLWRPHYSGAVLRLPLACVVCIQTNRSDKLHLCGNDNVFLLRAWNENSFETFSPFCADEQNEQNAFELNKNFKKRWNTCYLFNAVLSISFQGSRGQLPLNADRCAWAKNNH